MLLVSKKSLKLLWKKFYTLIHFIQWKSTLVKHELCAVSHYYMYVIVQAHSVLCLLLSSDKFYIHFGGFLEHWINEYEYEHEQSICHNMPLSLYRNNLYFLKIMLWGTAILWDIKKLNCRWSQVTANVQG